MSVCTFACVRESLCVCLCACPCVCVCVCSCDPAARGLCPHLPAHACVRACVPVPPPWRESVSTAPNPPCPALSVSTARQNSPHNRQQLFHHLTLPHPPPRHVGSSGRRTPPSGVAGQSLIAGCCRSPVGRVAGGRSRQLGPGRRGGVQLEAARGRRRRPRRGRWRGRGTKGRWRGEPARRETRCSAPGHGRGRAPPPSVPIRNRPPDIFRPLNPTLMNPSLPCPNFARTGSIARFADTRDTPYGRYQNALSAPSSRSPDCLRWQSSRHPSTYTIPHSPGTTGGD